MEEDVVQQISVRDILAAIRRRWWLVAVSVVSAALCAQMITNRLPRIWQAGSQIFIKTPMNGASPVVGFNWDLSQFKNTQLSLFTNADVAQEIADRLNATGRYKVTRGQVSAAVQALDHRGTDLIDIVARTTSPQLSKDMADAAAFAFKEYDSRVLEENAKRDVDLMGRQLDAARKAMIDAMDAEAAFGAKYGAVDLPRQTADAISSISDIQGKVAQAHADAQILQTRITMLKQQIAQANQQISAVGGRNNGLIESLQAQLQGEQAKLREYLQETTPLGRDPSITGPMEAQIKDTQQQLNFEQSKAFRGTPSLGAQADLQNQLINAQRELVLTDEQIPLLQSRLPGLQAHLQDLPDKQRQYAELSMEAQVTRELYTKELETMRTTEMDRLATPSIVDVTQTADVPTVPISPNPRQNLLMGILCGLMIGLGVGIMLEFFDETIRSEADIRKLAPELPILGALPSYSREEVSDNETGLSVTSRAPYRLLWTNIGFAGIDSPIRSVIVTSAIMGEGKSLTCAYLARAAAEEGKRVILVDADLRRPSQHRLFHIPEGMGLCDVLSGKVSLDEALVRTDQPNLMVLGAGKTLPLNPAVLLKSERMAELMDRLSERADLVIYDTPPALAITDALLLSTRGHSIIQIVEAGHTKKEHIIKVLQQMGRARARHLGMVLNKMPKSAFGNYGYYYYYYHYYRQEGNGTNGRSTSRGQKTKGAS